MKVFIQSCHAALEYDFARMFKDMGHDVHGNWDIGSVERPKIAGITDKNSDWHDFDFIVLMQVPKYTEVMQEMLQAGKRVILSAFGQSDTWQYTEMAKLTNRHEHAYIANYSLKDLKLHASFGASEDKSRLIRFAKYLGDFKPWSGNDPQAYSSCNSVHLRGVGCGWEHLSQLMSKVPVVLSGVKTDEVGGLGQVSVERMHELFASSACFASFGTMPAAMVLTQIEAVCAGAPLVIWDNGFGCREEGLTRMIHGTDDGVANEVSALISDAEYRKQRHEESMEAREMFNVKNIIPLWEELIERVMV
jgi:glycosyltransferase involved in cell wall biosynthesis